MAFSTGEPDAAEPPPNPAHDPYSALRNPALRHYLLGNVLAISGMQMEMLALRWELYERTGDPLVLGYVGLVQVLPVLALALRSGTCRRSVQSQDNRHSGFAGHDRFGARLDGGVPCRKGRCWPFTVACLSTVRLAPFCSRPSRRCCRSL